MLPSERREFVRTHRTCVFGYRRRNDGPAMSIVYYIPTDTDDLLVSTMAGRGKARVVERDHKVSLCVLDERGRSPTCRSTPTRPSSATVIWRWT